MQEDLQITFRNVSSSDWIEQRIRDELALLERYYRRILGCRVLVEMAHRRHVSGNRFHVRIDLSVPGEDIIVSNEPDLHASLQDTGVERLTKQAETEPERKLLTVVLDDAFETARRRLQDYARRQRGDTKTHQPQPHGRVVRLDAGGEYGFIEADDGHEVYFHRNSVLEGEFDELGIGSDVVFSEEPGERGPQASSVRRLGSRHYAST